MRCNAGRKESSPYGPHHKGVVAELAPNGELLGQGYGVIVVGETATRMGSAPRLAVDTDDLSGTLRHNQTSRSVG